MSSLSQAESKGASVDRKPDFWDSEARRVLQSEMHKADVDFEELARRLDAIGYPPTSAKALALRVSRGSFSFGFMLMVMQALGVRTKIDISFVKPSDRLPGRHSA